MPLKIVATEKALVEQAYDLRAELENTAADVSGLFSKIGVYYILILLMLFIAVSFIHPFSS